MLKIKWFFCKAFANAYAEGLGIAGQDDVNVWPHKTWSRFTLHVPFSGWVVMWYDEYATNDER